MSSNRIDVNSIPLYQGLEHGVNGDLGTDHANEYKTFKEQMIERHGFPYDRPIEADCLDISAQILLLIGLGWKCPNVPLEYSIVMERNEVTDFLFFPINEKTDAQMLLQAAIFLSMPGAAETVTRKWHPAPFLLELYKFTLCTALLAKATDISIEILATRIADYALETVTGNFEVLQFICNKVTSHIVINSQESAFLKKEIRLPPQSALLKKLQ